MTIKEAFEEVLNRQNTYGVKVPMPRLEYIETEDKGSFEIRLADPNDKNHCIILSGKAYTGGQKDILRCMFLDMLIQRAIFGVHKT